MCALSFLQCFSELQKWKTCSRAVFPAVWLPNHVLSKTPEKKATEVWYQYITHIFSEYALNDKHLYGFSIGDGMHWSASHIPFLGGAPDI